MNETVVVTGGTGYLGSRICQRLLEEHYSVILLKRSTSPLGRVQSFIQRLITIDIDLQPLSTAINGHGSVDAIIHCATIYGRKQESPASLMEANLMLPLRLLTLAAEHGVRSFLNSDTFLHRDVNEYSLSKKQFLDWLKFYSQRLCCVNLRLEHFYGPRDDPSKFLSWLIGQFVEEAREIPLTPGYQTRDFVYIDDVVDAYMRVLRHSLSSDPCFSEFDVGSGTGTTIRDLVSTLQRVLPNSKATPKFGALPYRPNEMMQAIPNISRLVSLGWQPAVSLENGLHRTVEIYHLQTMSKQT